MKVDKDEREDLIFDDSNYQIPDEISYKLSSNSLNTFKNSYQLPEVLYALPRKLAMSVITEKKNPLIKNKGKIRDDWQNLIGSRKHSTLINSQARMMSHQRNKTAVCINSATSLIQKQSIQDDHLPHFCNQDEGSAVLAPLIFEESSLNNLINNSTNNIGTISKNRSGTDAMEVKESNLRLMLNNFRCSDLCIKSEQNSQQLQNDNSNNYNTKKINYNINQSQQISNNSIIRTQQLQIPMQGNKKSQILKGQSSIDQSNIELQHQHQYPTFQEDNCVPSSIKASSDQQAQQNTNSMSKKSSFGTFMRHLYNKIVYSSDIIEDEPIADANYQKQQRPLQEQLQNNDNLLLVKINNNYRESNVIIEVADDSSSLKKNKSNVAANGNLRKSQTFHGKINQEDLDEEELLQNYSSQFRIMTQKKILLNDSHFLELDSPQSKSYVYMSQPVSFDDLNDKKGKKGIVSNPNLGNNNNNSNCDKVMNYRSAFFQHDEDLEVYYRQLKEALVVQFQKEINISHEQIKAQYNEWVNIFQAQFVKKSPFRKTLVFDLDETLVRAQRNEPINGFDGRITVIDPNFSTSNDESNQYFIFVKFRPFLIQTLVSLKEHYELILFTAASEQYADIVLQTFDGHKYFDHILSRKQCLFIFEYGVYVKDLTILLNGRSLKDIIIVDNKIESYSSNLENGIPITSYIGQQDDLMLQMLEKYLLKLKEVDDVRELILQDFFLKEIARVKKEEIGPLFNSEKIKNCVLKARDTYNIEKAMIENLQNSL